MKQDSRWLGLSFFAILLSLMSFATTSLAEEFKFSTSDSLTEPAAYLNFKNSAVSSGYPTHTFQFNLNPGQDSFSTALPNSSTSKYNRNEYASSGTNINNASLSYTLKTDTTTFYKFELDWTRMTVAEDYSTTARALRLYKSSVNLFSSKLSMSLSCWLWGSSDKLCLGGQIGINQMPVLPFLSSHVYTYNVTVSSVQDTTVGLSLIYERGLWSNVQFKSILSFDYGAGLWQRRDLSARGSQTTGLNLALEFPMDDFKFIAGLQGSLQTIPLTNGSDKWVAKYNSYGAQLGMAYTF